MEKRQLEISETDVVRWACYVGFFVCAVILLVTLSTGGRWLAMLVGVVIFGIPALKMYVLEQDRAQQARKEALWRGSQTRKPDWDLTDDGDPTVPPRPDR
jgi:hypothetical protein